jgi:alkylglycerol monooxygenase
MDIYEYVAFITKTPFPLIFIIVVILLEYLIEKRRGGSFSFQKALGNFGVLLIGTTIFSFFSIYVVSRESVLSFSESHTLFTFPVTWTMFFVWLIVFDFVNYWTHVLYHKSNFFWMFHSVHHSDKYLDASTSVRVPIVASFFVISSYFFLGILGVSIVLLPALAQTMFLQQVLVHSTLLRGKLPSWVEYVFVTPDVHAIHHTERFNQKNYSFLFTFWDRLFGSFHNKRYEGESFGVEGLSDSRNPFRTHYEPIRRYFRRS